MSATTQTKKQKVSDLVVGQNVSLKGDSVADPNSDHPRYGREYSKVKDVIDEGDGIRVDFENTASVRFPYDHEVQVDNPRLILLYGLNCGTSGALAAWGARAIYSASRSNIDIVPDRHSANFTEEYSDKSKKKFFDWVNKKGLKWLKKQIKERYIDPAGEQVLEFVDGKYKLSASPNSSHGYMYIRAEELPESLCDCCKVDISTEGTRCAVCAQVDGAAGE